VYWKMQRVAASYFGVHGMPGFPFVEEQTAGGYYAVALIALWITRHHFKRELMLFLGRPVDREDPWERKESRLAVGFIVVGLAFLLFFCHKAGMSWSVILIFFVLYFLISIAVTRMRAELGPPA